MPLGPPNHRHRFRAISQTSRPDSALAPIDENQAADSPISLSPTSPRAAWIASSASNRSTPTPRRINVQPKQASSLQTEARFRPIPTEDLASPTAIETSATSSGYASSVTDTDNEAQPTDTPKISPTFKRSRSYSTGFLRHNYTAHITPRNSGRLTPGAEHYGQPITIKTTDYGVIADNRKKLLASLADKISQEATTTIYADKIGSPTTSEDTIPTIKLVIIDGFQKTIAEAARQSASSGFSYLLNVPHPLADGASDLAEAALHHFKHIPANGASRQKYARLIDATTRPSVKEQLKQHREFSKKTLVIATTHVSPTVEAQRHVYDTGKKSIILEHEVLHALAHLTKYGVLPPTRSLTNVRQIIMNQTIKGEDTSQRAISVPTGVTSTSDLAMINEQTADRPRWATRTPLSALLIEKGRFSNFSPTENEGDEIEDDVFEAPDRGRTPLISM